VFGYCHKYNMSYVYWIRTKNISSLNDGYIGVTGIGKKNKTPQDRLKDHINKGRFCKYCKKEDLILDIIFTGTEKECFLKEKELRPKERMGWNIAPGGEGGYKGNHFVKKHGILWADKIAQTKKELYKSGKIVIWSKGKKLPEHLRLKNIAKLKQKTPYTYTLKNIKTNEIIKLLGFNQIINFLNVSKSSVSKLSAGKKVSGCHWIIIDKKINKFVERNPCV